MDRLQINTENDADDSDSQSDSAEYGPAQLPRRSATVSPATRRRFRHNSKRFHAYILKFYVPNRKKYSNFHSSTNSRGELRWTLLLSTATQLFSAVNSSRKDLEIACIILKTLPRSTRGLKFIYSFLYIPLLSRRKRFKHKLQLSPARGEGTTPAGGGLNGR